MQELLTQLPPWAVSLSIMVLMVALGLVVHSIAYAIALRIARRTARKLDELFIEHSRAPARLLFPLAFIIFAWSAIPPSPEIAFAGERILGVLFIVGIAWLLVKMLAVELGKSRVRVNVVCPGAIETEIDDNTKKRHVESVKPEVEYPEGSIPLTGGAPGKAEQVADLVAFLVGAQASHITGTEVWIDGGQSLVEG